MSREYTLDEILKDALAEERRAGIKEVVDAIKYPLTHIKETLPSEDCPECQRQSKLKEWGLE